MRITDAELAEENPKLAEALERILIPNPADSGTETDDYVKFLQSRARLLLGEVRRLCGQLDCGQLRVAGQARREGAFRKKCPVYLSGLFIKQTPGNRGLASAGVTVTLNDLSTRVVTILRHRRAFLSGIPLHIVQRGHDRQPVFVERNDYAYYLANMAEAQATHDLQLHAYCLMTNHVHLLLSPGDQAAAVSAFMRVLAARQTRHVNKREGRTGTLWEGRFKASPVDSAAYLLACYRYIELNPVRARIVVSPRDYDWSSYRHNSGEERLDWLEPHTEFQALGSHETARAASYRKLVGEGLSHLFPSSPGTCSRMSESHSGPTQVPESYQANCRLG